MKTNKKKQRTSKDDNNDMKDENENAKDTTTTTDNSSVETAKQELINDLGWYQLEWNKLLLVQQNWKKQVQANNIAQEERRKERRNFNQRTLRV